ncbi:hypothetical protein AB1Y20_002479 [Prymnesium parvum]|uniref:Transmembrane protein 163 n=1 Tax=Prymnesium parvum TaxID=97485 RepID=A0AB34J957_PRYPA|mmetsp:Transcript_34107/g.82871  ORF Transcript_34107/g.82871 Transcript_34107/m.82871 type:complete len:269 (-) Transcript_34107:324-1130(-)
MAAGPGSSAAALLRVCGHSNCTERLEQEGIYDADLLLRLSYAQLRECNLSVAEAQLLWEELSDLRSEVEVVKQTAQSNSERRAAGLDSLALVSVILCSVAANYIATYVGELSDHLREDWHILGPFIMMFVVEMLTIYSTFICVMHSCYSMRRQGERGLKLHLRIARIATLVSVLLFVLASSLHSAPFVDRWCTSLQLVLATLVASGVSIAWWSCHQAKVLTPRKAEQLAELRAIRAVPLHSSRCGSCCSTSTGRRTSIESRASVSGYL